MGFLQWAGSVLLQTIAPLGSRGTGQDGRVLPFTRVRVLGPSMEPHVCNGDWWVVRRTARLRVGDVVLMTHPNRPDALIVKRLDRRVGDGWWVLGDNPAASEDSRHFGTVGDGLLIGILLFRYRPVRRGS
jgi:nickel-type superoxide dismutase maturation protease